MFFADRILSISSQDRVLEIGPGATPHPRSDVFLEKIFETEKELVAQSGHVGKLQTNKKVVTYSGDRFPFKDKQFDYVICSHVLEHVEDVPLFLSEVMRVAKKGYLEFPTIYYEYLYNIEEHLNVLVYRDGVILWCKKSITPMSQLAPLTDFFRTAQFKGYRMQNEINQAWHHGFEWFETIEHKQVNTWQELCYSKNELEKVITQPGNNHVEKLGVGYSLKLFVKSVAGKLGLKK